MMGSVMTEREGPERGEGLSQMEESKPPLSQLARARKGSRELVSIPGMLVCDHVIEKSDFQPGTCAPVGRQWGPRKTF